MRQKSLHRGLFVVRLRRFIFEDILAVVLKLLFRGILA